MQPGKILKRATRHWLKEHQSTCIPARLCSASRPSMLSTIPWCLPQRNICTALPPLSQNGWSRQHPPSLRSRPLIAFRSARRRSVSNPCTTALQERMIGVFLRNGAREGVVVEVLGVKSPMFLYIAVRYLSFYNQEYPVQFFYFCCIVAACYYEMGLALHRRTPTNELRFQSQTYQRRNLRFSTGSKVDHILLLWEMRERHKIVDTHRLPFM